MNCDRALELLLEAEPAELVLFMETPLVEHVRECARCAAVATRLRDQAEALTTVARRRDGGAIRARVGGRRRTPWIPAGAAVAAGAALWLFASRARSVVPPAAVADAPIARGADSTAAPQTIALPPLPRAVRAVAVDAVPPSHRFAAERIEAVAFVAASVPASGRNDEPRNVRTDGVVSVAPPAGVRATIMQTNDPTVTVVWLQPADTTRSPR